MADTRKLYFDWVDALKAFAIIGILWNHVVEGFGSLPWFTNPANDWPDFSTRIQNILPQADNWFIRLLYFIGWLGDSGPGVFILLSGFGLALSTLQAAGPGIKLAGFYRRRLLRIYPLYLLIHFLTVLAAFFLFGPYFIKLNTDTLFSFLGLRFKDSIFFHINPSWWFIWLVLQLYAVFPFLFRLMRKAGPLWFFLLALGFTILSRGAGIAGIRYSNELFSWMTGIFFGTRLAEFALGMVLADYLWRKQDEGMPLPRLSRFLPLSLLVYLAGLLASMVWAGTLVSNLLVTAGLCGLFYSIWQWGVRGRLAVLRRPLIWLGVNSFGAFLLHQAPLNWSGRLIENPGLHLAVALLIVALSFPVAGYLEKMAGKATGFAMNIRPGRGLLWGAMAASALLLGTLVILSPARFSPYVDQLLSILIIGLVICLAVLDARLPVGESPLVHLLLLAGVFASAIRIFIFPPGFGLFSVVLGAAIAVGVVLFYLLTRRRLLAWALSFALFGALLLAAEVFLRARQPLETPVRWGEYPALEIHPTRVYGLKPELDIRLRYNNYDYVLKTNSQGLASPEIGPERSDPSTLRLLIAGDAFSMPEGLEYEYAYPALLEKVLMDSLGGRPVQVINGGVTGYGPVEAQAQISELAPLFRPDIVVYQFFINEFEEVNAGAEERLRSIGLITDLSRIEREIFGSQVLAHEKRLERKLKEMAGGKSSNYRYEKSLLRFYEKEGGICSDETTLRRLREKLAGMQQASREYGAAFVVLFVPGQAAVSSPADIAHFPAGLDTGDSSRFDMELPFRKLSEITDALGIPLIGLTPYLKSHPAQPVYFPESWHWNREGHKAASQALFEELKKRGLL